MNNDSIQNHGYKEMKKRHQKNTLPVAPNRNGPHAIGRAFSHTAEHTAEHTAKRYRTYSAAVVHTADHTSKRCRTYSAAVVHTAEWLARSQAYRRMGHHTQHTSGNNLSPFGWLVYTIDYD